MLPFAFYLLKVSLVSGLLYIYYLVALRNKKFHQYNRFYLLLTVLLSLIIPLVKINFLNYGTQPANIIKFFSAINYPEAYVKTATVKQDFLSNYNLLALYAFLAISAAAFLVLIFQIIRISFIIRGNPKKVWNDVCFVFTKSLESPFSFFRYIFWNENMNINGDEVNQILQHELTHVKQLHSADKLFLNLVLAAGWANPFFWIIRKELSMLHEFIADQKAITDGDTHAFSVMLLNASYAQHSFVLTNSFFHSPIKRRLIMFTTSKKPSYSYLRRLMVLPLLSFVIVFFSFKLKGQNVRKDTNMRTEKNSSLVKIIADTQSNSKTNDTITNKLIALSEAEMSWKNLHKQDESSEQISITDFLIKRLATEKYLKKQTKRDSEVTKYLEAAIVNRMIEERKEVKRHNGSSTSINNSDTIEAKFPGGDEAWKKYLEKNLDANVPVTKDKAPHGDYTVKLEFIVTASGEIEDISATKVPDHCPSCAIEAVRMIKLGPKWDPMTIDGKKVTSKQVQFISFRVEK